jgi:hypothetical protein
MTVSCIRCEVWNERRRAAALLLWAMGRARAALRSAEGMRDAMVFVDVWGGVLVVMLEVKKACLFGRVVVVWRSVGCC